MKVLIIGGGVCGLTAARLLREQQHEVLVLDKGRGPGGRASSRRAGVGSFDHGAQYFTARDASFQELVQGLVAAGVVAPWEARFARLEQGVLHSRERDEPRYVGVPRMAALGRHLAQGLDLRQERVLELRGSAGEWCAQGAEGDVVGPFDRVLLTAPAPQSAALLPPGSPIRAAAEQREMLPCWAALLAFDAPLGVPFDGAHCDDDVLAWVARESSKPGRGTTERWVLHSTAEWAAPRMGEERSLVVRCLTERFLQLSELERATPVYEDSMFWRFASPASLESQPPLHDEEGGIVVAGDTLHGGRVEGAFLSGAAAARLLDPSIPG